MGNTSLEVRPYADGIDTVRSAPSRSEREGWRINELFGIGKAARFKALPPERSFVEGSTSAVGIATDGFAVDRLHARDRLVASQALGQGVDGRAIHEHEAEGDVIRSTGLALSDHNLTQLRRAGSGQFAQSLDGEDAMSGDDA